MNESESQGGNRSWDSENSGIATKGEELEVNEKSEQDVRWGQEQFC